MAATADVTRGRLSAAIATALAAAVLIAMGLFLLGAPAADAASTYAHLGTFSGPGSADGEMVAPRRVAVDAAGNVLVVDSGNDRIQVFSPTPGGGSYLTEFGGGGVLNDPYGIAVDRASGAVYVSDAGNSRIVRFTSNGLPVPSYTLDLTYPSPAQGGGTGQVSSFASPIATVPGTGDLVVADTGSQTVKRFNADGSYDGLTFDGADSAEGAFTDLLDLAVDSTGDVIVVHSIDAPGQYPYEMVRGRVSRFSAGGSFEGAVAPQNAFPGAVAVNSVDQVLITDNQFSYTTDNPLNLRLYSPSNELVSTTPLPGGSLWSRVHGLATGPGVDGRAYVVTDQVDGVWGLLGRVAVEAFEPVNPIPPDVAVLPVSAVTANSGTLNGTVDPNAKATSYHFDYRTASSGSWTSTPDGDAGDGDTPVAVSADLSGLTPNTTYQFRLVATNPDGADTSDTGSFTTAKTAPVATTLDASQVTDTSAWLRGEVNPSGEPTKYRFEYGTTTNYDNRLPANTDASAGQGVTTQPVSTPLHDLQPNTTYHYRIVAQSPSGRVEGTDKAFTTKTPANSEACPNAAVRRQQGSEWLPDCRAFEQVSPSVKFGYALGTITGNPDVFPTVTSAGNRITFVGFNPLPGATAGSFGAFTSERHEGGWVTTGLLPAPSPGGQVGGGNPGFDGVLRGLTPDQRVSVSWDYSAEPFGALTIRRADGSQQRIAAATTDEVAPIGGPGTAAFEGISDDGRRVVFGHTAALVPGVTSTGDEILYEWIDDGANDGAGTLRVVSRTNDPVLTPISGSATLGSYSGIPMERIYDGAMAVRNAISADGSRIFFQAPAPATSKGSTGLHGGDTGGALYLREGGASTTEISAPADGHVPVDPPDGYRWLDASHSQDEPAVDGRYAFFWADGDLTADAPVEGGIYRYDVDDEALSFLATAPRLVTASGNVPGAIASEDGSRLYYQKGPDVHLYEDGATRAVLEDARIESGSGEVKLNEDRQPAVGLSGNGRFFVFRAIRPQEGLEGQGIFLYDAETDAVERIAGAGSSFGPPSQPITSPLYGNRVMSEDGRYVFFDTSQSLDARDTNGVSDVYQWHDGAISLLTRGTHAEESRLAGVDATGKSVFVVTADKLALTDGDEVFDLYAVRSGGGTLRPSSPGCEGDACQRAPEPARSSAMPGSVALRGLGDDQPAARPRVTLARLSAGQRVALSRGRAVTLRVRVSRPGRIVVLARARLRGQIRVVAKASRQARRSGTLRLRLRLAAPARADLAYGRTLRVALSVRLAGGPEQQTLSLRLRRPR